MGELYLKTPINNYYIQLPKRVAPKIILTFDNGAEFCATEMSKLESAFPGLRIYFTESYSSWQKGSIENSNGELRWYYPKGTDFAEVAAVELKGVAARLNNKPMKCHGWRSSQEVIEGLRAPALNKAGGLLLGNLLLL